MREPETYALELQVQRGVECGPVLPLQESLAAATERGGSTGLRERVNADSTGRRRHDSKRVKCGRETPLGEASQAGMLDICEERGICEPAEESWGGIFSSESSRGGL
jgi:hypothetical protein